MIRDQAQLGDGSGQLGAEPAMSLSGVFSFAPRVAARRARIPRAVVARAWAAGRLQDLRGRASHWLHQRHRRTGAPRLHQWHLPSACGGRHLGDSSCCRTVIRRRRRPSCRRSPSPVRRQTFWSPTPKATITADLPDGEALIGHSHVILRSRRRSPVMRISSSRPTGSRRRRGRRCRFSLAVPANILDRNVPLLSPLPPADDAQPPENIQTKLSTVTHLMVDHILTT